MAEEDLALPAEQPPSSRARLTIKVGPDEPAKLALGVGPDRRWGTAEGTVPPDQARHLITAFCILGSAGTGIAGAVLTLRIAPSLTTPALAELILALAAAVLTAACSLTPARRDEQAPEDSRPDASAGNGSS
jgi:hypothetical protein